MQGHTWLIYADMSSQSGFLAALWESPGYFTDFAARCLHSFVWAICPECFLGKPPSKILQNQDKQDTGQLATEDWPGPNGRCISQCDTQVEQKIHQILKSMDIKVYDGYKLMGIQQVDPAPTLRGRD